MKRFYQKFLTNSRNKHILFWMKKIKLIIKENLKTSEIDRDVIMLRIIQ
jgi:hypothetical protein